VLFSVVIPTYNRQRRLADCLSALRMQGIGSDSFEIIVVDDGNHSKMAVFEESWPKDAPRLRVICHSTRKGPAAARNTGVRAAAGEYLAFTDDDCRPHPDWLAELHRALQTGTSNLLGGRVENGEPSNRFACFNQALLAAQHEITSGTPSWYFSSNNFCLSARHFQDLQGFDESFPDAGGEDRDFCFRWQRSGRAMRVVPTAIVYHHHPQSIRSFLGMHYRYGRAARRLYERAPSAINTRTAALVIRLLRRRFWLTTILSQIAVAVGFYHLRRVVVLRAAILSLILLGFYVVAISIITS